MESERNVGRPNVMSSSEKKISREAALHSDAYLFQRGEYYPKNHQANVQRLHQKYPEFPLSQIDAIYRKACKIDLEVQQHVGTSQLTEKAKEELLDWLEDHYYPFSRASFLQAIDASQER